MPSIQSAKKLRKFLHTPIDNKILEIIKKSSCELKNVKNLGDIEYDEYKDAQKIARKIVNNKGLLIDFDDYFWVETKKTYSEEE